MAHVRAEGDPIGAVAAELAKPWVDRRASAKASAAAQVETIKRQALWRAAHLSAAAARASGSPRYVGHICGRNPSHGGERYTSGGGCVACRREAAERRRRRRGAEIRGPLPQARHSLRSSRRAAARRRRSEEVRCG